MQKFGQVVYLRKVLQFSELHLGEREEMASVIFLIFCFLRAEKCNTVGFQFQYSRFFKESRLWYTEFFIILNLFD